MTSSARKLGVGDRAHVVRCNYCKVLVASEHRTAHALECRAKRNRAKLAAVNLEKNGQQFYAIVATRFKPDVGWSAPTIDHVHAYNPDHARAQFLAGENKNTTRILEVGLAIGWFQDAQGNLFAEG